MSKQGRRYSLEFKLTALERMGRCTDVRRLAAELGVSREILYLWHRRHQAGGVAALRPVGRPRRTAAAMATAAADTTELDEAERARRRIAELERKIGEQQLELDFFRAALKRVREPRPASGGPGETASTQ